MATHKGECFCGAVHVEVFGLTGSNGILPLPIMQVLVSCPGYCFHPLETRRHAGYCGCGTCCHVPKDQIQSTAILQEMRWPSHEQPSYDRIGGCICSDVTHLEVQPGCALPMRDGLPKLKDFPKEFGGSGEGVLE